MKWLSRKLFPHHARDMREKEMQWLTLTVLVSLTLGLIVGCIIYFANQRHG